MFSDGEVVSSTGTKNRGGRMMRVRERGGEGWICYIIAGTLNMSELSGES